MRLHHGAIPEDFEPDESWRSIREPGPFGLQLMALPVGILCAALTLFAWAQLGAAPGMHFRGVGLWGEIGLVMLSFPILIVVHELLHAAVHPGWGSAPESVIGVWPSRMIFYAHYAGALARNRFLTVFAMPFLVITVLPLALAASGILPSGMRPAAAWFSAWNAFFACGDCVGFALILLQVPREALVRNKGWRSYWKPR
ncbi:DUF3267 domain-containing protein [Haloferula sp. BvORR071]|uniref:DUF3267 domain-containing protein n=1 Tax=Haloferula sp. BvORR071 TaxID=1396141 RepID=UPI0005500ED7|nr:DUF3267 domain-containing protein [Haloferula sp. BvORR071]